MPKYTPDEKPKNENQQHKQNQDVIKKCIAGLGIYASQQAQVDPDSPKIAQLRYLIDTLAHYWGLDYDGTFSVETEHLKPIDRYIESTQIGLPFVYEAYRGPVINGLRLYAEEMISAQGYDAKDFIQYTCELMGEIASAWDFESDLLDNIVENILHETSRLPAPVPETLPGHPESGEFNQNYEIKQAILFDNNRGFALGAYPERTIDPFVTWQFTELENGERDYYWGHYCSEEGAAKIDFCARVKEYLESYSVKIVVPSVSVNQNKTADSLSASTTAADPFSEVSEAPPKREIPEQVLNEKQPYVTITYSEHASLRNIEPMPLYIADELLAKLSAAYNPKDYDGKSSVETKFKIDFIWDGKPDSYTGTYQVGLDPDTLISHIRDLADMERNSAYYQNHYRDSGILDDKNKELDKILKELVPYFEVHTKISKGEAVIVSELMSIFEAADGFPDDIKRMSDLEAITDYIDKCRNALNNSATATAPEPPRLSMDIDKEKQSESGKPSVRSQINAEHMAKKPPRGKDKKQGKSHKDQER